jgi:hypothetical protein
MFTLSLFRGMLLSFDLGGTALLARYTSMDIVFILAIGTMFMAGIYAATYERT